jgi:AcrR family transcriptional regulator
LLQRKAAKRERGPRTATRALRREQLMRSTIESIARRGFAGTTLADVADGAGLSRGIVNFHFQSKDQLLDETLEFLADEYRAVWTRYLERAGPTPPERLLALVLADYDPAVCNRKKLAVWFAFWGESKSRPNYLRLMGDRDTEYEATLRAICSAVIDEGNYGLDHEQAAASISSLSDGMWLSLLVTPRKYTREGAKNLSLLQLSRLFPKHYNEHGDLLTGTTRR